MSKPLPCLIHVDEHVLVVAKPPGINTHRPSATAPLGIHEWISLRYPEWGPLSVLHRLDKDTSGVLVMGRTAEANRSITAQFERRTVQKRYVLVTHGDAGEAQDVRAPLQWSRGRAEPDAGGQQAQTLFQRLRQDGDRTWYSAVPRTGRSHQIRAHAAAVGIPILGDTLYGGAATARCHLHAESLSLTHPGSGEEVTWTCKPAFETHPALALRSALLSPSSSTYYRVLHGAADGAPGLFVDCLGEHLVAQTDGDLSSAQRAQVSAVREALGLSGAHHRRSDRHVGTAGSAERSPQPLGNTAMPGEIIALENEISWALRLDAGYSHGLFADQRDNRWRILHNRIAPGVPIHPDGLRGTRVLNTFAYTCGFSVCAATAGAHVTSIDLSARWLEWGKHNFTLNGIDPEGHLFMKGDVLSWLPKLGRQGRRYELVILDPPTFARMARKRVFRAERDYGALIQSAAPLVAPGGWILASTNAQRITGDDFQSLVAGGITAAGHTVDDIHFAPQPFDFPVHKEQPAHLKTVWVKIGGPGV